MTGSLLSKTSRITPPAEPVMQPMMMATQIGWPHSMLFWMPATLKSAKPNVSKTNQALSSLRIQWWKSITNRNTQAAGLTPGGLFLVMLLRKIQSVSDSPESKPSSDGMTRSAHPRPRGQHPPWYHSGKSPVCIPGTRFPRRSSRRLPPAS